jgi:hypothetical protein
MNLLDMQRIDKTIALLRFDHLAIAEITLAIIDPEIKARNLAVESVASCFDGDVLEAAGNAILEGLENFSPSGRRKLLTRMITKAKELEETAIASALREPTLGDSDSSSPESSESTQQVSHSAN